MRSRDPPTAGPGPDDRFARKQQPAATGPGVANQQADDLRAVFAAVRVNGNVVARSALAGRYAPEFDSIGNDRPAMQTLAKQTGGAVIKPDQHLPIDFQFPVREVPLTSWLALAGAVFIGLALARWNWG